MKNVFEIASREKYRFPFKGSITTEDLWDLSPDEINVVYKALAKAKKNQAASNEDSLYGTIGQPKEYQDLENKIEIVKYVFDEKQKELMEKRDAAERNARNQKILGLIAEKEDEELKGKSVEELKKLLT